MHMRELIPVVPGDRVAVLSPSAGLPALFPEVFDLGLERMRNVFHLEPVEFPTTRQPNAPLRDRARDIMAAFADPSIKAVFASIGGHDQIKLLKFLQPEIFEQNPKAFFGYSDNTHLHNFLWRLGIPSYYGAAVMTQFGMNASMFDMTIESINNALFEKREVNLSASAEFTDQDLDWSDPSALSVHRPIDRNEGWHWDGTTPGEGRLWGGCLESLLLELSTNRWLPASESLEGAILYFETSEDLPPPWVASDALTAMGERGWLSKFSGVIVGRPKAWATEQPNSAAEKVAYRRAQREAVVEGVREYNADIPIVQNVDIGHTDPQLVVPSGNLARIDASAKEIWFRY